MTDIVAFIEARLDEDEAVARAAADPPCCEPLGWRAADRWSHRPRGLLTRDDTGGRAIMLLTPDYPDSIDSGVDLIRAEDGGIPLAVADHIVTWDPARVLAEIAAKRRILGRHRDYDFPPDPDDGPGDYAWTPRCDTCFETWPCPTLLDLAAPYAGHPDYDPAWKAEADDE